MFQTVAGDDTHVCCTLDRFRYVLHWSIRVLLSFMSEKHLKI